MFVKDVFDLARPDFIPACVDLVLLPVHDTFGYAWGFDAMVYRVSYALLLAGNKESAERVLHQAIALSRELNAPYWLCRALLALAELSYESGKAAQGHGHATEALELAKGLQHREFISTTKSLVARNGAGVTPPPEKDQGHRKGSGQVTGSVRKNRRFGELYAPLPEIPPALEIPIQGTDAVMLWLDQIVARRLSDSSGA